MIAPEKNASPCIQIIAPGEERDGQCAMSRKRRPRGSRPFYRSFHVEVVRIPRVCFGLWCGRARAAFLGARPRRAMSRRAPRRSISASRRTVRRSSPARSSPAPGRAAGLAYGTVTRYFNVDAVR
jgi:hypothetical protein